MNFEQEKQEQGGQDNHQPKELGLFNALGDSYLKSLIYFELETQIGQDESLIKEKLKTDEFLLAKIQNFYVLHGNKSLLFVCKSDLATYSTAESKQQITSLIQNLFDQTFSLKLVNKQIPFAHSSYLLVSELSDLHLSLVSSDKSTALKLIESKTGLKLKKIKKSIYFTGFLFQFVLLNSLVNDLAKDHPSSSKPQESKPQNEQTTITNSIEHEWSKLYSKSEIKYNFKIKTKTDQDEDFFYDIYLFHSDLTDLNTDCLVNAANPNLHPGYVGEGVSRRIREKAGKQMQDACKKILLNQANHLLEDSQVCYTKSSGKLKSKYVLHAVCPTWTKCILEAPSAEVNTQLSEKFESLVEKTFFNIFKQAHDSELSLGSIAFPVSSNSSGGAFDLPLELFSHIFYTQLANFQAPSCSGLKTICITSLELNTVKTLIDLFSMYSEMCSTTLWAVPESPITKLITQQFPNYNKIEKTNSTAKISEQDVELLDKKLNKIENNFDDRVLQNKNSNFNLKYENTYPRYLKNENDSKVMRNKTFSTNNANTRFRTSLEVNNQNQNFSNRLDYSTKLANQSVDSCCLFCQKENNNNTSSSLVACGNEKCKSAFCEACLYNYVNRQHTNKCPSCRLNIDTNLLGSINNNYNSASFSSSSSSSSSSSISPTRLTQPQYPARRPINSSQSNQSLNLNHKQQSNKHPVADGKIFIRKLDEPCAGYEKYKSLLVTFEMVDGIQNENHPKPGHPYKGTTKRAYLPEIKEHIELLAFYEKALKTGLLFRVEFSRSFGDYRVHLNQDVLLKTSQNGSGRFGYPDPNYIDDLLKMARNSKF